MTRSRSLDPKGARIPRCCARHDDWPTLAQHLVDDFPNSPLPQVARELRVARDVVDMVDVGDDALYVAELIARHRLMLAAGEVVEAARLDPQPHARRARTFA